VLAVTAVAVTVIAASSASAATAAAGAAAGAGATDFSESKKETTVEPVEEAPLLKAAIDEHVVVFKETLAEQKIASKKWDEKSLSDKAREIGSNLAHTAFDEISVLVEVVPQLCKEVKDLGARVVPDSLKLEEGANPVENYEKLVAKGHEAIDTVFATEQAERFTTEAKESSPRNNYDIGVLPLPNGIPKLFSNTSNLIKAGDAIDRAGYSKAGRSLMKHGYREGSAFPKPKGNPSQVNAHGQKILESIVNHPERVVYKRPHPDFDRVIEVVVPDMWGVRFTLDGEMIGFLEP